MWIRIVLAALVIGLIVTAWKRSADSPQATKVASTPAKARLVSCPGGNACRHVFDMAGVLPPSDVPRFEQYMDWIQRESDVDVRFAFVRDTGSRTIEELAVDMVDEMRIGGKTREERGVLLLYDVGAQRLKVEVGYGLEGYFPDAFVSYLVHDHARMFFESGNISFGLRLMLRLLQHRIREAVLGNDFDPRVLQAVDAKGYLSGGAGVSANVPSSGAQQAGRLSEDERNRYLAQATPAATYDAYVAWLAEPVFDADVDLFTRSSRGYLAQLPLSPAYRQFILFAEYGKRYSMEERGDLALLVFTGTPFVSPHFFVREEGVWRMDIVAEVRDTVERVGGIYTWDYRGQDDAFTQAFSDRLVNLHGYRRFRDGDNRELRIRGELPNAGNKK
jgi:uncharacterized protein